MISRIQHFTLVLLISLMSLLSFAQVNTNISETDPMLVEAHISPLDWNPGQGGELTLKMKLPPEYYAYEDKIQISISEPEHFKVGNVKISPIITWDDKFSKKMRSGFKNDAILKAYLEAPLEFVRDSSILKIKFSYQACTSQFCLFPTHKEIQVPIHLVGAIAKPSTVLNNSFAESTESFFYADNINRYLQSSLWFGLIFVFLAGIVTSFTPCIFPMIPITLAVLGNDAEKRSRLQNFFNSLIYVLGIATTYSLLGLIAASTGGLFGASLGNPIVLSVVCIIFLAMSLSMYGLYDLQVPAFLRNKLGGSKKSKTTLVSTYLTGLFAGIVASPCVGPVLVAILTYVASTQNKLIGFFYLFFYALGLGLIFLVLGLFNQATKFLPRSGPWMNSMKFVLGSLMLSAFFYYLNLLIPERFFYMGIGLALVVLGSVYGAFLPVQHLTTLRRVQKGFMQALLVIGFGYMAIGVLNLSHLMKDPFAITKEVKSSELLNWQPYDEQALVAAKESGKPVIIDFWAEWCAACHELEAETFTHPRVRSKSEEFVLLKFDATKNSAELKSLKSRYSIQGLPTIVFIDKDGNWRQDLTLTAFEKAPGFLERMEKASK